MTTLIVILALCGVSIAIGSLLRSAGSAYPTLDEMAHMRAAAKPRRRFKRRVQPPVTARDSNQGAA